MMLVMVESPPGIAHDPQKMLYYLKIIRVSRVTRSFFINYIIYHLILFLWFLYKNHNSSVGLNFVMIG